MAYLWKISIIKESSDKKELTEYIRYFQKKQKYLESKIKLMNAQFDFGYIFISNEKSLILNSQDINSQFIGIISPDSSSSIVSSKNEIIQSEINTNPDMSVSIESEHNNINKMSNNIDVLKKLLHNLIVETEDSVVKFKVKQE